MVIGSISSLALFLVEDTSIVYLPLVSKVIVRQTQQLTKLLFAFKDLLEVHHALQRIGQKHGTFRKLLIKTIFYRLWFYFNAYYPCCPGYLKMKVSNSFCHLSALDFRSIYLRIYHD